ncbi:cysteine desulfurase SufS [Morganella morganii]|uniref:cysteine desulfurase SufS n=1 Tax=Morganella morganii TaxID=582 RepID=UPI00164534B3|nr:cysteine desulfurase SufS [Morganella morganii]MBC3994672.1 cysteine desulfurase SufS [Morganella morganii]
MSYSAQQRRADFPVLAGEVNGKPLVYLDSAASAQKPQQVIDAVSDFTAHHYAAVHRGIHTLSAEATAATEAVRQKAAAFINAPQTEEIIFVKGTTEAINLVADSFGRAFCNDGDNIIITEMEHHANIVPWYMLAESAGIEIRVLPMADDGTLVLSKLPELIDNRTRLLSFTHLSNVLGTVNPVKAIIAQARELSRVAGGELAVLVDGAQGAMHQPVDVQALDCDFYAFSGHKLYGPTGIGILWGRKFLLDNMPPREGGGAMIAEVSLTDGITYADVPWRFEAGTPNIQGIIGLGAALDYLNNTGMAEIAAYEHTLMQYALTRLAEVPGIILYGNAQREGVIAFNLGTHHAFDTGAFLDRYGVAVRTGHHCAQPLLAHYGVSAMCRASLALYTTEADIDILTDALKRTAKLLG